MVHMFSVPAGAAFSACQSQPRMIYITNTELDDSGSVRAIHSHRETAEIALVYQGHGAHKIDNRIYNSEPGDLLLYNTGILHQDLSSTGEEPMCFLLMLNVLPFAGFAITLVTGTPWALVFALLLTGIGRGAVSNYNNQIVSTLSGGSAAPLNMLHGFFAIGAVLAPVLVLLCTHVDRGSWRWAVLTVIVLGVISMISSPFMKMDELPNPRSGSGSFGFLRNRRFLLSMSIMFFYLCVEASVMGWMVTYYADSGAVAVESAQLLTSMLWVVILAGRFICGALSGRIAPPRMILALCGGILVFLAVLLMSAGLIPMLVGTVGLGLALSGMYGTTVANAGSVFGEYPLAMGVFVTISSLGSVITPSLIGDIASHAGIRMGMAVLLVPAAAAFALAVWNWRRICKAQSIG